MDRSLPSGRWPLFVAFVLVALLLAACAGGAGSAPAGAAGQPAATAGPAGGAGGDNGNAGNGGNGREGNDGGSQTGGDPGGGPVAGNDVVLPEGTRIVYNGTLSLQVEDVDGAVTAARGIVRAVGGFLAGSRQSRDGEDAVASITYRIPADRWEDALESLRELGTVVGEETDAAEVTDQIVDLEARIRTLRASEATILRLTEKATAIEDLLEVESRLSQLRTQIEQLDAQRASLEDRASLGTLTVTFGRAITAIVEAAEATAWDARKDVTEATGTLVGVLQTLTSAGIWLGIVWLPVLAMLGLLALAVRFVLRRTGVLGRIEQEVARPTAPGA